MNAGGGREKKERPQRRREGREGQRRGRRGAGRGAEVKEGAAGNSAPHTPSSIFTTCRMLLPGMAPACLYEALRSSLLLRKGARTKLRGSSPEWRHKLKPAWQASGVQQLQLAWTRDLSYDDDLLLNFTSKNQGFKGTHTPLKSSHTSAARDSWLRCIHRHSREEGALGDAPRSARVIQAANIASSC